MATPACPQLLQASEPVPPASSPGSAPQARATEGKDIFLHSVCYPDGVNSLKEVPDLMNLVHITVLAFE